jgi:hypothetical protein
MREREEEEEEATGVKGAGRPTGPDDRHIVLSLQ